MEFCVLGSVQVLPRSMHNYSKALSHEKQYLERRKLDPHSSDGFSLQDSHLCVFLSATLVNLAPSFIYPLVFWGGGKNLTCTQGERVKLHTDSNQTQDWTRETGAGSPTTN